MTGGTLTIQNCTFSNNSAATGAGICASGGNLILMDSTVTANSTPTSSSGLGAGLAVFGSGAATIISCLFTQNVVNGGNGGAAGSGISGWTSLRLPYRPRFDNRRQHREQQRLEPRSRRRNLHQPRHARPRQLHHLRQLGRPAASGGGICNGFGILRLGHVDERHRLAQHRANLERHQQRHERSEALRQRQPHRRHILLGHRSKRRRRLSRCRPERQSPRAPQRPTADRSAVDGQPLPNTSCSSGAAGQRDRDRRSDPRSATPTASSSCPAKQRPRRLGTCRSSVPALTSRSRSGAEQMGNHRDRRRESAGHRPRASPTREPVISSATSSPYRAASAQRRR